MYRWFVVPLGALVAALAIATTSLPATAAAPPRLAGPWYTPKELKALIAYSNAAFSGKVRLLAGSSPTTRGPVPTLTPEERRALDRYANASFAEKQRILAGEARQLRRAGVAPWLG